MVRSLSPLLRQELANLEKDADSRRSAMKTLTSYAKDLDSKAIPHFLAEVSENNGAGVSSGECTISLYEVLARVHGRNIVPQIDNIMLTIMRTLSASGGSFALHQACAKVVPAIARYGIDPSTLDEEKARIVCSLCKPLSNALMGSQESVAPSGAAFCLKALVECSNWRFAPDEMVNEVCLKVAGALEEKLTQSNAHMGLVMALVKHNGLIAEAYSRSFVRSGLQILANGVADNNSQKRLTAVQMINFLMKYVDARSILSELFRIIDAMEKCQADDRMPFVRGAAFEALQTAKVLCGQKGSRHEVGMSPISSSNFQRKNEKSPLRLQGGESSENDNASEFCSPESQTVDSGIKYDGLVDSPVSVCQSNNFDNVRQTNRRLWNNDGIGVDVSLKDGFGLKACLENNKNNHNVFSNAELMNNFQHSETNEEHSGTFSGFMQGSGSNSVLGYTTPRHRITQPGLGIDDIKIYTTPRRLIHSLQSSGDPSSGHNMEKQDHILFPNSPLQEVEFESAMLSCKSCQSQNFNCKYEGRRNHEKVEFSEKVIGGIKDAELANDATESVSSTAEVPENSISQMHQSETGNRNGVMVKSKTMLSYRSAIMGVLSLFFVILAVILSLMRDGTEEFLFEAVPT